MPHRRRVKRYRILDVGRPGSHYLQVAAKSGRGPRGGTTTGRLISRRELLARLVKARAAKRARKRERLKNLRKARRVLARRRRALT
jgi:hypothetical protein